MCNVTAYPPTQSLRFHGSLPVETYDAFGWVCFRAGENNNNYYSQWFPITVVGQFFEVPDLMKDGKELKVITDTAVGVTIDFIVEEPDKFE